MAVRKEFPRAPELGTQELKVDLGWARAKSGELRARVEKLQQCPLNLFLMLGRLQRRVSDIDSGCLLRWGQRVKA